MADGEGVQKSDWNLAQAFVLTVADQITSATLSYGRGDIERSFYHMKSIRMLVVFKLTTEEIKHFEKLEENVSRLLRVENQLRIAQSNRQPLNKKMVREFLELRRNYSYDQYHGEVTGMLSKYGFLVGVKEDETSIGDD